MGFKALTVAITGSQTGTVVITRYIDLAGTIVQASVSTPIVAATLLVVNVYDNLPYVTFRIVVTDTGVPAMTVTNFLVVMNST